MEEKKNSISPIKILLRLLRNKKMRIGITILYTGMLLFAFDAFYNRSFLTTEEVFRSVLRFLPYVFIIVGIGYFLISYLEGNKIVLTQNEKAFTDQQFEKLLDIQKEQTEIQKYVFEKRIADTNERLERLSVQIESLNSLRLDSNQKSELFGSLKKNFTENINKEFFQQLNENISTELTKEKRNRLENLLKEFNSIKSRLNTEIEKLSRRANVNLVIGSLTTIVALITLGYIVFQSTQPFKGYVDMLYHYIPRLSLIIFVEVFAYFFLKLYKSNLNDMKYYQNELTTVELKLASITTAIHFGKDTDISLITSEFSKTERNFILKKDETTVEIEKTKLDKGDLKDILKFTTDIVNKRQ